MNRFCFLLSVVMAPVLSAEVCFNTTNCTLTLDSTEENRFGAGPYGTVNLALVANTIKITVDLADGLGFNLINTGSHKAFTFNNNLGGAAVEMSSFNSTLYSPVVGSPGKNSPFGAFMNGVESTCTDGSGCGTNTLVFTVTTNDGFANVNQLIKLSTGNNPAYFAADIANGRGVTGVVGATSTFGCIGCGDSLSVVPEPSYVVPLISGFGLLVFARERRRRKAVKPAA